MAQVLFVTTRVPFPPREGHQLRSWHLLRAAAAEHQVTLLSLRRPDDPASLPPEVTRLLADWELIDLPALRSPRHLLATGIRRLLTRRPLLDLRYRLPALERAFARRAAGADLVHLDMLALAGLLRWTPSGTPAVLNEHNVESRLLQSRLELEERWSSRLLHRLQRLGLEAFERRACLEASAVLACSSVDASQLKRLAPAAKTVVVPNGVDIREFSIRRDTNPGRESLVFVGQMSWFPNRDGIEYFARDILPRLAHRSALQIDVVGRHDGRLTAEANPRLRFHGFVDDLKSLVHDATIFIVPLRVGSGTRLKVLEAMALGKAIVSTSKGVEGIGLTAGENVLLADTADEFAAAVERLLDDPELRRRLGQAARRAAVQQFDWDKVGERLQGVYEDLLARRSPCACGETVVDSTEQLVQGAFGLLERR